MRLPRAVRWFRNHVPTSVWLAVLVQAAFLISFAATDAFDVARSGEAMRLVLTFATLVALFGLIHLAIGPASRLYLPLTVAVYTLVVLANFARIETVGAFDYAFAHENIRELATPLGRHIVGAQVKPIEVFAFLVCPLAASFALFRWRSPAWQGTSRSRVVAAIGCVAFLVLVPLTRLSTHESLTTFIASGVRFHTLRAAEAATASTELPYVREFIPSARGRELAGADAPRPHILLLFLESWSGVYTDRLRPDGRRYTPVFDARRRSGLTFDHFYGSSIQSSRGRFATLCSLIPLVHGKEFQRLAGAPLNCLPKVLSDAGYSSLIDSASDEPTFERSNEFFREMGFSEVRFHDPSTRGRDPDVWGAGLQDDVFYRGFFARLDEHLAREPAKPLFAVAINASNHYPFDQNPKHRRDDQQSTKYAKNYVASLANEDVWLETFFEELERRPAFRDAIVVLVGDHSFPADEHGIHFNGLGAYEESFRTAFMLSWRGHVPAEVVPDRAASQIDIAPTIADLLQLQHTTHFIGRSLVADDISGVAPMVQPYDGVRLVAVRYPFKLERHEAADQEHLYDLSNDPEERHDRLHDPGLHGEVTALRAAIARVRANDAILRSRRVWSDTARR